MAEQMNARPNRIGTVVAVALGCVSSASSAADLVFDVGAGHIVGVVSTQSYGLRGSVGIDFGTLEPAFVALWSPGPNPGPVSLSSQRGGQVLHGLAGLLRVHTPPPHQAALGVGFGFGRMEAAQSAGAFGGGHLLMTPLVLGYRGTTGPYTVIEIA